MRGKEENADYWGKLAKVSFSSLNMILLSSSFAVVQTHEYYYYNSDNSLKVSLVPKL